MAAPYCKSGLQLGFRAPRNVSVEARMIRYGLTAKTWCSYMKLHTLTHRLVFPSSIWIEVMRWQSPANLD